MGGNTMTFEEIRLVGLEALARELGPVGMVRFLQQFETGYGDYSAERQQWLGTENVRMLAELIQRNRSSSESKSQDSGSD